MKHSPKVVDTTTNGGRSQSLDESGIRGYVLELTNQMITEVCRRIENISLSPENRDTGKKAKQDVFPIRKPSRSESQEKKEFVKESEENDNTLKPVLEYASQGKSGSQSHRAVGESSSNGKPLNSVVRGEKLAGPTEVFSSTSGSTPSLTPASNELIAESVVLGERRKSSPSRLTNETENIG